MGLRTTLVRPLWFSNNHCFTESGSNTHQSYHREMTCAVQHACTVHFLPPLTCCSHCCTFKHQSQGLLSSSHNEQVTCPHTLHDLCADSLSCSMDTVCGSDASMWPANTTVSVFCNGHSQGVLCRFGRTSSSHCDEVCEEHNAHRPHCSVHHPSTQHGHFPGRLCNSWSALCLQMPCL